MRIRFEVVLFLQTPGSVSEELLFVDLGNKSYMFIFTVAFKPCCPFWIAAAWARWSQIFSCNVDHFVPLVK